MQSAQRPDVQREIDGKTIWFPGSMSDQDIDAAIGKIKGGSIGWPGQPEKSPFGGKPTPGPKMDTLGDAGKAYIDAVDPIGGLLDLFYEPGKTLKSAWQAHVNQFGIAKDKAKAGNSMSAAGHAMLGLVPFRGPAIAQAVERAITPDLDESGNVVYPHWKTGFASMLGLLTPGLIKSAKNKYLNPDKLRDAALEGQVEALHAGKGPQVQQTAREVLDRNIWTRSGNLRQRERNIREHADTATGRLSEQENAVFGSGGATGLPQRLNRLQAQNQTISTQGIVNLLETYKQKATVSGTVVDQATHRVAAELQDMVSTMGPYLSDASLYRFRNLISRRLTGSSNPEQAVLVPLQNELSRIFKERQPDLQKAWVEANFWNNFLEVTQKGVESGKGVSFAKGPGWATALARDAVSTGATFAAKYMFEGANNKWSHTAWLGTSAALWGMFYRAVETDAWKSISARRKWMMAKAISYGKVDQALNIMIEAAKYTEGADYIVHGPQIQSEEKSPNKSATKAKAQIESQPKSNKGPTIVRPMSLPPLRRPSPFKED